MELWELIKQFRQENDISQREFARRCGLSNSLISILEMGVNPQSGKKPVPDLGTYQKLAAAMGMSMQELFEKTGNDEYVNISLPDDINPNVPKTEEARILSKGIDQLPEEQRQ